MSKVVRKFSIQVIIVVVFISAQILSAQQENELPDEIQLIVNGSELPLTPGWIDSMADNVFDKKIYYKIIGASRKESTIITQVQIPQILSLNEVFRQIILYYTILPDEDSREKELLNIYPYFESIDGDPPLKCHYISEGIYNIEVKSWTQIQVPTQPNLDEKVIYNQIVQYSFYEVQSFGNISENVFEKIAIKNKLSVERVKEIYRNTILWRLGKQNYSQ